MKVLPQPLLGSPPYGVPVLQYLGHRVLWHDFLDIVVEGRVYYLISEVQAHILEQEGGLAGLQVVVHHPRQRNALHLLAGRIDLLKRVGLDPGVDLVDPLGQGENQVEPGVEDCVFHPPESGDHADVAGVDYGTGEVEEEKEDQD